MHSQSGKPLILMPTLCKRTNYHDLHPFRSVIPLSIFHPDFRRLCTSPSSISSDRSRKFKLQPRQTKTRQRCQRFDKCLVPDRQCRLTNGVAGSSPDLTGSLLLGNVTLMAGLSVWNQILDVFDKTVGHLVDRRYESITCAILRDLVQRDVHNRRM